MELVLYVHKYEALDAVSLFAKSICRLYRMKLSVVQCEFAWTAVGDLPVLRIDRYLYTSDRILSVLKFICNESECLGHDGLVRSDLLGELCISKLHSCSLLLVSQGLSTRNLLYGLTSVGKVLSGYLKLRSGDESFSKAGIERALEAALDVHEVLSGCLSTHLYFSSVWGKENRPHVVDMIVYAYLKEHLFYLGENREVQESFEKHTNLIEFVRRIEDGLGNEDYKVPNVEMDKNFLASMSFKQRHLDQMKVSDGHSSYRRGFVTGVAFAFFSSLLVINLS